MATTPIGPFLDDPWIVRTYTGSTPPDGKTETERIAELETRVRQAGLWDSYIECLEYITSTAPQLHHLAPFGKRLEAAQLAIRRLQKE